MLTPEAWTPSAAIMDAYRQWAQGANVRYPLTAKACVDVIVTNYAVIEVTPKGLLLKEAIPGISAEDVQNMTDAPLIIADDFHPMELEHSLQTR